MLVLGNSRLFYANIWPISGLPDLLRLILARPDPEKSCRSEGMDLARSEVP